MTEEVERLLDELEAAKVEIDRLLAEQRAFAERVRELEAALQATTNR